jgi:hypothetical protein
VVGYVPSHAFYHPNDLRRPDSVVTGSYDRAAGLLTCGTYCNEGLVSPWNVRVDEGDSDIGLHI